ncbi:MAG: hypothetical protein ACREVX_07905 [Clostridium sp.]|uniref:hypothetical protein n=1 Tax=Clostridium sp. TaxID=1506 RepID=UPI003D6C76C5
MENMDIENKSSFLFLLKQSKKIKEVISIKDYEVWISLVVSLGSSFLIKNLYNIIPVSEFNNLIRVLTSNIAVMLVTLLGFSIGGLAIISGTLGSKLVQKIEKEDKMINLIGILFSFYFIGFIIGITIIIFLLLYICSYFPYAINIKGLFALVLIATYLFSFSIFYSVSLLGTCIRMFKINYDFSRDRDELEESKGLTIEEIKSKFDHNRINSLLTIMLTDQKDKKRFLDELENNIEHVEKGEEKDILKDFMSKFYRR